MPTAVDVGGVDKGEVWEARPVISDDGVACAVIEWATDDEREVPGESVAETEADI